MRSGGRAGTGRMMRTYTRTTALVVLVAAFSFLLAGCIASGPSGQERAERLVLELESSDLGVSEASAEYSTSISSTMVLRITLDDSVVASGALSAAKLKPILAAIGRGTQEMRLGSMDLFAKDAGGKEVSLAVAADELGLTDSVDGKSLVLVQADLREIRAW
ncbi:hypothetical protein QE416_002682 [Microbacterium sp. SORGH_AS 421]|nr:hypothetical protein [Microbacterium sp. SORGH_AS_0421]